MSKLDRNLVRARFAMWQRGQAIAGHDPDVWLKDAAGEPMCWYSYQDCRSPFGWDVDPNARPRRIRR